MSGAIAGTVLNMRTGEAVEGADVQVRGAGGEHKTTTEAKGFFSVQGLEDGEYELTVSREGFDPNIFGPIMVVGGGTTDLRLALEPPSI